MLSDEHLELPPRPVDGRILRQAREARPIRGPRVTLALPDCACCDCLAGIERTDTLLREQLRQSPDYPVGPGPRDGSDHLRLLRAWCEHRHGVAYAIIDPDAAPVGLIALWGLGPGAVAGSVGFWLRSDTWGRGCATEALALLIRYAGGLGLGHFGARVPRSQTAVWRTWSRLGARITENAGPGLFGCELDTAGHGFDAALAQALCR